MIYIVRHGQTEMNNRKVLQGRSDYPLNDAGIAQAQKAADELGIFPSLKYIQVHSNGLFRQLRYLRQMHML